MKLYHFVDPGECGFEFVVLAEDITTARQLACDAARSEIPIDDVPAVHRSINTDLGSVFVYHQPLALAIFTEGDPIAARVSQERLRALEDAEAELIDLKKAIAANTEPV